jgi:hypothetical protein
VQVLATERDGSQRREREIEEQATGNGEQIMALNENLRKIEQASMSACMLGASTMLSSVCVCMCVRERSVGECSRCSVD